MWLTSSVSLADGSLTLNIILGSLIPHYFSVVEGVEQKWKASLSTQKPLTLEFYLCECGKWENASIPATIMPPLLSFVLFVAAKHLYLSTEVV